MTTNDIPTHPPFINLFLTQIRMSTTKAAYYSSI